jgi:beta-lactamase class A
MKRVYYKKNKVKKINKKFNVSGIFLAGIVLFFAILLLIFLTKGSSNLIDPNFRKILSFPSPSFVALSPAKSPSIQLEKIVKSHLANSDGSYGVYIKNLKTGEYYLLNENRQFRTASLYKLWVMAALFEKVKEKSIDLEELLESNIEDLNSRYDISDLEGRKDSGVIALSVNEALDKMITESDNYSALILSEKVGFPSIANFLKNYEFQYSSFGSEDLLPTSTAMDIGVFFEMLYTGEIIDKEYSDKMISLLKRQKLNHKIPRDLPLGIVAAHKTGELDEFSHDAGIVYASRLDYIIVIFSESDDPASANSVISTISRSVYDYFDRITL